MCSEIDLREGSICPMRPPASCHRSPVIVNSSGSQVGEQQVHDGAMGLQLGTRAPPWLMCSPRLPFGHRVVPEGWL
ncbi:hypothetical protein E2562_026690 [Oryza meyeriana var. granulata]|uniref:Uncharacterized protein n=1 Tax=Oryza meyeriana var. granulata TaxID=110450 RepID=A0A6G1E150_9ORYZ|nr:hypothetical protein E2562_026690 [Oryza meyeriana var. granulata]